MAKDDDATWQTDDGQDGVEASFVLSVADGTDKGRSLVVGSESASRVLAGTSPVCELRLDDRTVSRRHAAFAIAGRRLRITDLGSTNGTTVGDLRVMDALLRGGEVVRLGSTTIEVRATIAAPPAEPERRSAFGDLLGVSPAMRRLYPICERLAKSDLPVLIEGETGTGKEILAEALHRQSPRAAGPFVVFDCTATHANLLESELFGHERGAFTGAIADRDGVFARARGGTLLIDEIGDLDAALQPKLLRVLERSMFQRVGGSEWVKTDVRVLAATRRDLDQEVQAGRFRDDLFHRLAVVRVELPPLRARRGDVKRLAIHFCKELGGEPDDLPRELLARWDDSPWPGNLRELRNAVARHLAIGDLLELQVGAPDDEPGALDWIDSVLDRNLPLVEARQRVVDEFERRYVDRMLSETSGSVADAARAAGVAKRYFQLIKARRKT